MAAERYGTIWNKTTGKGAVSHHLSCPSGAIWFFFLRILFNLWNKQIWILLAKKSLDGVKWSENWNACVCVRVLLCAHVVHTPMASFTVKRKLKPTKPSGWLPIYSFNPPDDSTATSSWEETYLPSYCRSDNWGLLSLWEEPSSGKRCPRGTGGKQDCRSVSSEKTRLTRGSSETEYMEQIRTAPSASWGSKDRTAMGLHCLKTDHLIS